MTSSLSKKGQLDKSAYDSCIELKWEKWMIFEGVHTKHPKIATPTFNIYTQEVQNVMYI